MNKKRVAILTAAGLTMLTLAGCGNQSSPTNSGASSSSLLASKSSTKISGDNLTPQQMVSVVTTYAGNKYGNQWAQTAKDAKKSGLQVDLYPSSNYKLSDNGQGVAYNVKAAGKSSNLVYTVKGDDVTIFQGANKNKTAKKLATVSRSDMVNYINDNGQGNFVNSLSQNAQVNDKRSGDDHSSSSSSSSSSTGKYGNEGAVTVPAEMRGTWYTADNDSEGSVTFGKNTFQYTGDDADGNDVSHLYKQSKDFAMDDDAMMDHGTQEATRNWMRTNIFDHEGMHWLHMEGWCQSAGDGSYFAVHTENIDGKQVKVLVQAGGAGMWTDSVYYQTKDQAQQNADRKFDDLHYQDDDD